MSSCEENMYLDQYLKKDITSPVGPDYQNMCKLKAEECFSNGDSDADYWLTESLAASLRTMALYRHEQQTWSKDSFLETLSKFRISDEKVNTSNKSTRDYGEMYSFLNKYEEKYKDIELAEGLSRLTADCDPPHIKILRFTKENKNTFLQILKEFPKEWTVIQLTAPYNPSELFKPRNIFQSEILSFYVTVLRNEFVDLCNLEPFTVKVKSNQVAESEKELLVELYSLLEDNLNILENGGITYTKNNIHKYWERREDTDLRMKGVIDTMDKRWLCGWKCLLRGKFKDRDLAKMIFDLVEATCADWGFIRFSLKQKTLLAILLSNCHHISSNDLRTTIKIILLEYHDHSVYGTTIDTSQKIGCGKCNLNWESRARICGKCLATMFEMIHHLKLIEGIKAFMSLAGDLKNGAKVPQLKAAERLPVILIVDELLDTLPWESLPILTDQPVTRMESIHFLYYLFKINESSISNGYFTVDPKIGRFVINPENDLEKMEKRMSSFVSYWCPDWEGVKNKPPEPNEFLQYLKDADLYLYCGHGDGCQYAQGARSKTATGLEAAGRVRVAALLSGCNSVSLHSSGGRVSPLASHHYYHIVGSPVVVGMLWEVTDFEVDKVMSMLLASFVSSDAPVAWETVDKTRWSEGKLDFNVEGKGNTKQKYDLLTAISKARRSSNFIMISSSIVSRGLPVRLRQS